MNLDNYIEVEGNTVVCRTHVVVFILTAFLIGAGIGSIAFALF